MWACVWTTVYFCIVNLDMGLKCEKAYTDAELRHFQDALYVLNGKWKMSIIRELGSGYTRFTELKKRLPLITPRMLSKELKELESNHLIEKSSARKRILLSLSTNLRSTVRLWHR